jgi:hypothetical protein
MVLFLRRDRDKALGVSRLSNVFSHSRQVVFPFGAVSNEENKP